MDLFSVLSTYTFGIENLNYPSLDELVNFAAHLSYCQFTSNELRSGYAWSILNESS